jgi:hypothetical protein
MGLMRMASGITHYAHTCKLLEKTYGTLAMPTTFDIDETDSDNHSTRTSVPPDAMDNPPNVILDSEPELEQNDGQEYMTEEEKEDQQKNNDNLRTRFHLIGYLDKRYRK